MPVAAKGSLCYQPLLGTTVRLDSQVIVACGASWYARGMKIRAVIFDRDNTLVQFERAAIAALGARVSAIAPEISPDVQQTHWLTWPGPWPRSVEEEPAFWHAYWGALAARYALPADATHALQAIGAFYHTCFTAFPDVVACLAALRSCGLRLAVLTNFELPSVHLTLAHAGIDPGWFTALLSSSSLGLRKPDLRAYQAAAAALDLPPDACVFVDDLLVNVEAACAAGMRGILLDREHVHTFTTVERINSLHELVDLLTANDRSIGWT